ncbi:MAG: glyoxalase/bleomycin resistance/dioxygenase family protein [Actinobacteria bacterium]|nr:glyoxalase/bleomycin resistance/dioxygenase family protein [Actinomycetota bacterium]MCG2803667.1 hypothetical protein [Cellulomonas sp.]
MASTFSGLTYDAFDAQASALFWAAVLRLRVAPGATAQRAELEDPERRGAPRLVFRQVTDGRPLRTPLHLELSTTDLDAEACRLVQLGARRLGGVSDGAARWVTLADPEGNAFDLVRS